MLIKRGDVSCRGRHQIVYEGDFDALSLNKCDNILIRSTEGEISQGFL